MILKHNKMEKNKKTINGKIISGWYTLLSLVCFLKPSKTNQTRSYAPDEIRPFPFNNPDAVIKVLRERMVAPGLAWKAFNSSQYAKGPLN